MTRDEALRIANDKLWRGEGERYVLEWLWDMAYDTGRRNIKPLTKGG